MAKLTPAGSALTYATFLGGSDWDQGYGIALDGTGSAYVTGYTYSSDFTTTPGAFDTSQNGPPDAFAVKLNLAGSELAYSTFLGGGRSDFSYGGIAVDAANRAYVTGGTCSVDFPTTPGAFDTSYGGCSPDPAGNDGQHDGWVIKLNQAGSGLIYGTFLGGSNTDWANAIAVDGAGSAYVVGFTLSGNLPTTSDAFDPIYNGSEDAFVIKLNPAGSELAYGSYLGGRSWDQSYDVALSSTGLAYMTGYTGSSDFPTTPGAFDRGFNGGYNGVDAFVAKLTLGPPLPYDAAELASQSEYLTVAPGAAISPWIEVRNTGTTTWTPAQYGYNGRGALQGQTGYITRNVAPGGTYRFFWNLNAPTTPGVYDYGFMLRHGTQEFGPYFFVRVTVILTPDTGFRANPNGFASANRQLYRSWDMFRQFFGAANVQKADGTPCAVAQAYFNDNYRAVAGGWSCVGFATTSMISYLNLAQQNAGPYAMAAYPRLYEQPWSSTLSQPIAFYSGTQLTSQYAQAVAGWHQTCDQEPFGLVERIRQSLVARDPLLLSIPARIGAQTYYHMVSPYNLVDISETEAHVYVYDSEAPGNNGKIMRFTRNASGWQWQYTFAGSLAAGGTNTGGCQATHAVRLSILLQQGQPTVNWCSSTAALQSSATNSAGNAMQSEESEVGSGRMMVFLPGEGDGFIRDTSGRRLGQINGQPVSEIPDALLVPQASAPGMQTSRSYYVPAGQYTLQTSGQGAGLVDSAVFGDGRLVAVEGQLEGSTAALLGVPSNLASANVNDPSAYASFAVTLIEDQPTASQTALVSVTQPNGSEPLALSSHGNQVLLSRAGGNLIYSLAYRDRGSLAYISAAIAMGANEAHTLIRNSSTVTLQIDLGRNGTIDETRTLTNQVKRAYLPRVMR